MTMETTRLSQATIEQFADALRGRLIQPTDPGYDEARSVWNGMIDRRPALIAQCASAEDVAASVTFAREHGLPLAAKGGGHHVAGKAICDDGLVVDLSTMRGVQVNPAEKTARVEAGATWGDLDGATQEHGLATTGGVDSRTGVAGLTLGGGNGYLARAYGLAVDNLVGADVVTADGKLVRASESEHPDLFWALRGAGGSFGIVTSFEFQLHDVGPEVMVAQNLQPFENGAETLRFYRDFMANAPDELMCLGIVAHVPPADPFPEEFHGKIMVGMAGAYVGGTDEGRSLLEPLAEFGDPILAFCQPMPYTALQQIFDAGTPDGMRYYYKSQYLSEMSDDAINTILRHSESLSGPMTVIGIEPMDGAVSRIDPTATAFPHRNAAFNFGIWSGWDDPANDDEIIVWTREFHDAMTPYSTGGMYLNYVDRDTPDRVEAVFGPNYERLRQIKAKYDPENLFRLNQNIEPTTP